MNRILVTGAAGQLGRSLQLDNAQLLLTSRTLKNLSNLEEQLDITDPVNVKKIIHYFKPDIVLHLAAMTHVDRCETEPDEAYKINVQGTENLLNCFKGKFIFLSTDYVFNGHNGPYHELAATEPINIYGKTKLAAEELVRETCTDWVILRTNVLWNIGGQYHASFADWVVRELSHSRKVRIVNDQWNNPAYTKEVSKVINQIIKIDAAGLFHYGSSKVISRYDFALKIAEIYKLDQQLIEPVSTAELHQPAKRPLKSGLLTSKIESELGIIPSDIDLDIRDTLWPS